jgi:Fe-S-cluster containining protein
MIKQLIPQGVCLKCQGCCRYSQADSVWTPCLLEEEVQDLLDRKDLPPASISINKKILAVPNQSQDGFICAFLNSPDNKCRIYESRPLECQLYPFLISVRANKVYLTVDLNCPYVKENLKSEKFKEYTEYLTAFLNTPAQLRILKDNPQIIQAYEEVLDILELNI